MLGNFEHCLVISNLGAYGSGVWIGHHLDDVDDNDIVEPVGSNERPPVLVIGLSGGIWFIGNPLFGGQINKVYSWWISDIRTHVDDLLTYGRLVFW